MVLSRILVSAINNNTKNYCQLRTSERDRIESLDTAALFKAVLLDRLVPAQTADCGNVQCVRVVSLAD